MSRPASEATQLRTLKAQLNEDQKRRLQLSAELNSYRIRATKAEQELAEWKTRFDALLFRTPKEPT